ncbi:hypothetical protein J6590_063095 [Homalodisca vitripennis]|nr:hypothetical protein J6590_063095 [Homalodisca vitripennis]
MSSGDNHGVEFLADYWIDKDGTEEGTGACQESGTGALAASTPRIKAHVISCNK